MERFGKSKCKVYYNRACETCARTSDPDGDMSAWLRSFAARLVLP